jgi:hypothetical protein
MALAALLARELFANIFPQLADWLEGVFNQSSSTDNDARFASHSDARLHFAVRFFVFF